MKTVIIENRPYCHTSPTQRHHWLMDFTKDGMTPSRCKYCPKHRLFGEQIKSTPTLHVTRRIL